MSSEDRNTNRDIFHYEKGIAILNTQLDEVKREAAEAKARDETYKAEQLTLNRQQVKLNRRYTWFTGMLVLISSISGVISIWQATIAQRSANAAGASAEAAKSAAQTAAYALGENKRQFQDTLGEMRKQTRVQQKAASASLIGTTTAKKQLELALQQSRDAEKQVSANLVIEHFDVDYLGDYYAGKAKVSFVVKNVGNSAAIEIAERGHPGTYNRGRSKEETFAETAQMGEVDPGGFALDKGESKTFQMDVPNWIQVRNQKVDWYEWKRFTFRNVFAKTDSVCILVVGSKYGLHKESCLPVVPPKQKR